MKTTIEIPDELFRKAKATAALSDQSLREFVIAALEARLRSPKSSSAPSGWRRVFNRARRAEIRQIDRMLDADLERVDPREWR